jgi:hypothetical protein
VVKYAAKSEVFQMLSEALDRIGGIMPIDSGGEEEAPQAPA